MLIDVKEIKQKQDAVEDRRKKLVENFILFREGFFTHIDNFTSDAILAGVKGVEPLDKSRDEEAFYAFSTINCISLHMKSTNEALFSNLLPDKLSSKIFLYFDGNQTPKGVVTFQEADEKNVYYVDWQMTDEFKDISGKRVVIRPSDSGRDAANTLLEILYQFDLFWVEMPQHDEFKDNHANKIFGFPK